MALIINEIWRARNYILFQDGKADLLNAKQNVHTKFIEFSKVFSPVIHPSPEQSIAAWSPPPEDWIKINVDAALNDTRSELAVVARDNHGEVIHIWETRHHLCTSAQAEAEALLWEVNLAIQERWSCVLFEGDANCCFDALSCSDHIPDWSMNTIISNISSLAADFPFFKFSWVRRTCNSAAHVTALLDLP